MVGKRVRGALYVHRCAITHLPEGMYEPLRRALALAPAAKWNVARIERAVIGLLAYEDFEAAAFPVLLGATRVDLVSGRISNTDYSRSENPLILHRKELLVGEDHARFATWTAMTKTLDQGGLFADNHLIGRHRGWLERLRQAGLCVSGDEVRPT